MKRADSCALPDGRALITVEGGCLLSFMLRGGAAFVFAIPIPGQAVAKTARTGRIVLII